MEVAIIVGVVCLALGIGVTYALLAGKSTSKLKLADQQVENARGEAERITSEANRQAENAKKEAVLEAKSRFCSSSRTPRPRRRSARASSRPSRTASCSARSPWTTATTPSTAGSHQLSSLQGQLDRRKSDLDELVAKQTSELERIAGLTKDDAHDELISRVRAESVRDEAQILRESEQNVRAQADKTAREIISTAIQRCAADRPERSPSPPSTFPPTTSRAASSAARGATYAPSSRCPASPS